MKKGFKIFDGLVENILFVSSVSYVVICFLQVIFRYVFNQSLSWSEELSRYLFVCTVFFGSAMGMKGRRHVAVDVMEKVFSIKYRKYYFLIVDFIVIAFLVLFGIIGAQLALRNMTQISPAMQIPLGIVYMSIPVGSLAMIIYAVRTMILDFKLGEKKFENKDRSDCVC